jgi:dipeptidyl aminopeptidase/acylaminoacyl peptidase
MNIQRRLVSLIFLLVLSSLATPIAQGNGFTLEQVLGAPFPMGMVASPKGDKVAWVFRHSGRRNIYVAEAPEFKGRKLTRYDKDDGREVTELNFSPDGSLIAYVYGGPPNSENEIPNPTSDPAGAKQEVWIANVRTGLTARIGEGSEPFFSPRGERVCFSREDHLWSAPVTGGPAKKMFEIRGSVNSPAWSPDGSELAFVSSRGDHSFIAVFNPATSRMRFLQPSIDRDIEPRWSPDGKRIAFIRLFNVADVYSADRERLVPWAIWVVESARGAGKQIWKSGAGELASYSRSLGADVLQWAAGDRLVFGSEHTGWMHLYSIPAAGGNVVAMTEGQYEVENVAWPPDRSHVVVASNKADVDRRHLWKVNVTGGEPKGITLDESIEMNPVFLEGGKKLAFMHATGLYPILPYIATADGKAAKPLFPQALSTAFPANELVEPEQVVFKAADGVEIHGQLFKPKQPSNNMPAVVFVHGGPMRQMLLAWHYLEYYYNAYAYNQYLASKGYLVLSINFRSGIGYGRAFREAKHRGPRGASEYQDVVAAGKYLQSRRDVDPKRIGLWGGSYGGYLTAMGLARNSDLFAAGVDIHGVHDWSARVGRTPWATGSTDLVKLGRESSPIASVEKWKSPVLLIHGDDDRNVAFSQTVELVRKLRERGVDFEQLVFPDEVHDFLRHESWLAVYKAATDFFDRRLK